MDKPADITATNARRDAIRHPFKINITRQVYCLVQSRVTVSAFVMMAVLVRRLTRYKPEGQFDTSNCPVWSPSDKSWRNTTRPKASNTINSPERSDMPCTVKYTAFLAGFGNIARFINTAERLVAPMALLPGQFTVTVKAHSEDCPLGATARHVFVVTPTW